MLTTLPCAGTAIQAVVTLVRDLSGDDVDIPGWPAGFAESAKEKAATPACKYDLDMQAQASSPPPKGQRQGQRSKATAKKPTAREERENASKMAEWLSKNMKALTKKKIGGPEKERIMAAFNMANADDPENGSWIFLPDHYIELDSESASHVDYETLMAMLRESVTMVVEVLGLTNHPKFAWSWPKHLPEFEAVRLLGGE